jgi:hypothetical protein
MTIEVSTKPEWSDAIKSVHRAACRRRTQVAPYQRVTPGRRIRQREI